MVASRSITCRKSPSRNRISATLVLVTGLVVGAAIAASPGRSLAAPPANPGNSGVIRFADLVDFFVIDPKSGFTSIHSTSTPLADLCSGTPPDVDLLNIQLIASPSGALHALFMGSEHNVQIYPASPPGCANWKNLPLLYSGVVHIVRTDNDIQVSGPGADAFGWTATGTLTDHVHGGTVSYREVVRLVINPHADPNDPDSIRELVVDIQVH